MKEYKCANCGSLAYSHPCEYCKSFTISAPYTGNVPNVKHVKKPNWRRVMPKNKR